MENKQGQLKSIAVTIFATVATLIALYRVGVGGFNLYDYRNSY